MSGSTDEAESSTASTGISRGLGDGRVVEPAVRCLVERQVGGDVALECRSVVLLFGPRLENALLAALSLVYDGRVWK
jgi:hypothetical protein